MIGKQVQQRYAHLVQFIPNCDYSSTSQCNKYILRDDKISRYTQISFHYICYHISLQRSFCRIGKNANSAMVEEVSAQ